MSAPNANSPAPPPAQGIPLWVGALIVGVVLLGGGTYLTMQFLKETPRQPTVRGTTRPAPGAPGGGPAAPPGGPAAPGMGGPPGGGRPAGSGRPTGDKDKGKDKEPDNSKATPEEPSK